MSFCICVELNKKIKNTTKDYVHEWCKKTFLQTLPNFFFSTGNAAESDPFLLAPGWFFK